MADDGPAIKIGNVEDAEFTVNRYTLQDGEIVEQEVSADLGDEDMAEIEEDIEGAVDEAAAEYDETGEVDPEPDIGGEGDESDDSVDQSDLSDARQDALDIIEEEQITKNDFVFYRREMIDRGYEDGDLRQELWSQLRDEDALVVEEEQEDADTGDDPAGTEEDPADTNSEDSDEGDGGEEQPAPDIDLDEASLGAGIEDADQAWLATIPGSQDSDEAIDQFDSMIREGDVKTLNLNTNLDADEIMDDAGLERDDAPALILEYDGDYFALETFQDEGVSGPNGIEIEGPAGASEPGPPTVPAANTDLRDDIVQADLTSADELGRDIQPGDVVGRELMRGDLAWAIVYPETVPEPPREIDDEFADATWYAADNLLLGGPDGDWKVTDGRVEVATAVVDDPAAHEYVIPQIEEADDLDVPDEAADAESGGDAGGDDGGSDPDVTLTKPGDWETLRPGDEILLTDEESEQGAAIIETILDGISAGEVVVVPVQSAKGGAMTEGLPEGAKKPVALRGVKGGFNIIDLEAFVKRHA